MVNQEHQEYFIFAEHLAEMVSCKNGMWKISEHYILVKRRDKEPERAISYHGGEIWGEAIDLSTAKKIKITLHYGPAEDYIRLDEATGKLTNIVEIQHYSLPKDRLESYLTVMSTMISEAQTFEKHQIKAHTMPTPIRQLRHRPTEEPK
jgi:hypothetical protein